MATHMMNIYSKFHWNPSANYRDIVLFIHCYFYLLLFIYLCYLFFILLTAYCVFYIVCFYCNLGLLLIFYMRICRILLIQLLGCHIEINACLVLREMGVNGQRRDGWSAGRTTRKHNTSAAWCWRRHKDVATYARRMYGNRRQFLHHHRRRHHQENLDKTEKCVLSFLRKLVRDEISLICQIEVISRHAARRWKRLCQLHDSYVKRRGCRAQWTEGDVVAVQVSICESCVIGLKRQLTGCLFETLAILWLDCVSLSPCFQLTFSQSASLSVPWTTYVRR